MKNLFLPLMTIYFYAFKDGSKGHEYRLYDSRWNECTCAIGRGVTLSKGYGKWERLHGVVTGFRKMTFEDLPDDVKPAMLQIYGPKVEKLAIARISIKVDR